MIKLNKYDLIFVTNYIIFYYQITKGVEMKKQQKVYSVLIMILLILGLIGCGSKGKIPITTSSDSALEEYNQGWALFEKLRFQESIQHFENAIKADSTFAMAYLNLANVSTSAKAFFENMKKAAVLVDKVSEGERLWILGAKAGADGFPMKQREYWQQLVKLYPNDERAHNQLGLSCFILQDYALAVDQFQRAIEINPEYTQPYNQLGYSYRFLELYTDAENAFQKYIELIPDDPNPYDSYAELLLKIGKYDQSIENYQKALAIDPNFVASHIGVATNLNYKGDHKAARERLQKLLRLARNDGERRAAYFSTAVSFADEGKLDKALEVIGEQFKLAEKIGDAAAMSGDLVLMGNIQLEMGKLDKALVNFEKSIHILSGSDLSDDVKANGERNFLYNSGRVALKKNNLKSAKVKTEDFYKQAEEVNNPFQIRQAHELKGLIALAEKMFEQAIEEFEQSNLQNPYNLYRLAMAYSGKRDEEKEKQFLIKVVKFNALNNLNYAFIRTQAAKKLESK